MSSSDRGPGTRAGLSREAVLAAARALVEAEGLERLTMRRLAAELGVAPNAIYSHVSDKAALVDAVLDSLLADIDTEGAGEWDPRDGLVQLMLESRRVLLEQAHVLPRLLAGPMRGPNLRRLTEACLGLLAELGVEGQAAVDGLRMLLTYTVGSAALDAPRAAEPDPAARWAGSERVFVAHGEGSRVARNARALARPSADDAFVRGLGWLLDGIVDGR